MKHLDDALTYMLEHKGDSMEFAVALAFLYNKDSIESSTPFVITLHVEEYRRYQLSGCNIPGDDIRVEVVYWDDADKLQEIVECIGFIEDTLNVSEAVDELHKLIHDDLMVLRGVAND